MSLGRGFRQPEKPHMLFLKQILTNFASAARR